MNRCVVLMYHVVDEPRSDGEARFCCLPDQFRSQMRYLVDSGWAVIPLAQLSDGIRHRNRLPGRSVVITLDDGTACAAETALPILAEMGLTATVFVVSDLLGGYNEWMAAEGYPRRRMLSVTQLRELQSAGMDIGSHTAHHVRMTQATLDVGRGEAVDSKARLEDLLGEPVRYFAYPYGDWNAEVRGVVLDAGYEAACSVNMGKNDSRSDPYALKRVEVMGGDSLWQFRLKLLSGTHDMPPWSVPRSLAGRTLRRLRAVSADDAAVHR